MKRSEGPSRSFYNRGMPALTELSEEERLFQSTVRRFARERLAPHTRAMDDAGVFRKDLIHEMFELGLMGIDVPEEYGGQGGNFFLSILAIEELARVDPSAAVIVDVQNTLCTNLLRVGEQKSRKRRFLPRLAPTRSARMRCRKQAPVRMLSRSPCVPRLQRRSRISSDGAKTVDHKRGRSGLYSYLRPSIPRLDTKASRRFSSSAISRVSRSARKKTSSAFVLLPLAN